ncbi:MAG: hypothetical protein AAF431_07555 [Pseudomonadota bacterium]
MKLFFITILLIFSSGLSAKQISLPNSGVSFIAPDEFAPLSKEIMEIKWPSSRAPAWAIGNSSGSTTIAYDIKPNDISGAPLSEVMDSSEQLFDRMIPGIEWKERRILNLADQEWIFFEMTSNALDTDIYNIMLVSSYGKEMIVFNFNSTKEDFPKYEKQLRKSIESIKVSKES